MDDESKLNAFRVHIRLELIERLVLRSALVDPVLYGQSSLEDSRSDIIGWLDSNGQAIDTYSGEYFQDPAMAALLADESKDVIDKMKEIVDRSYAEIDTSFREAEAKRAKRAKRPRSPKKAKRPR